MYLETTSEITAIEAKTAGTIMNKNDVPPGKIKNNPNNTLKSPVINISMLNSNFKKILFLFQLHSMHNIFLEGNPGPTVEHCIHMALPQSSHVLIAGKSG
nr:hypothetical protein [Candidatus Sigynarchaeum springense]